MVLSAAQINISTSDLHSIEQAEGTLSARIISILAEAVAFRVLLASLLDQMETLQTAIPLQQVLDLVFSVLLWKSADE